MTDCQHEWANVSPSGSLDECEFLCGKCEARRIDVTYPEVVIKAEPQVALTLEPVPLEHIENFLEGAPEPISREYLPAMHHTRIEWTMETPTTPGWYWLRLNPSDSILLNLVFGSNRRGVKGKRPPNTTLRVHYGPDALMNKVVDAVQGQWAGPLEPPV